MSFDEALQQIFAGATAASVETETLGFKRDPHTITGGADRAWTEVDASAMRHARSLLAQLVDLRNQMSDLDDLGLLHSLNVVDRDDRLLIAGKNLFCGPEQDVVEMLTRGAAGAEPSVRRLREPLVLLQSTVLDLVHLNIDPESTRVAPAGGQEIVFPDFSRSRLMKQ